MNPLAVLDAQGLLVGANAAFAACTELACVPGDDVLSCMSHEGAAAVQLVFAGRPPLGPQRCGPGWSATVRPVLGVSEPLVILAAEVAMPSAGPEPWSDFAKCGGAGDALADAIEHLPIAIVLFEASDDGSRPRILAHNDAYAKIRGERDDQQLASPPPTLFDAGGGIVPHRELPAVAAALTGRPVHGVTLRFRGADGVLRTVLSSASPIATRGGKPRAICVILDITDRQQAEDARRRSEVRSAAFFEALRDPSSVFEAIPNASGEREWVYREVNDALLQRLGRDQAELVGRRIVDVFPDVAERLCPMLDSVLLEESRSIERESTHDDRDFLVRAFSIGDREVVVTALDITDRKAAERALRASKARFETTAMTVPGALYDYVGRPGAAGQLVYLSPGAEDIFEVPVAALVGTPELFWDRVVVADAIALQRAHSQGVDAQAEVECRIVTPNGDFKVLRFSWRASGVDADGTVRGSGFILDVTEAVATRIALDRSRRELTSLVERLPVGLFLERAGAIVYANAELARCCRLQSAIDLVGVPTSQVFSAGGEDAPPFDREREWTYRCPDGKDVVLLTSVRREIEFNGQSTGLVTVTDHTELRAMRAQLMQADRLASVGLLAAGVAHEVNNPLSFVVASMDAMTDALTARPIDDELLAQSLADARVGAHRVRQVVRDLKTFSHARPDRERTGPVDINALLDTSATMVQNEIRHRARLVKRYGRLPRVAGNEARLGQVFVNLLVNAAHAVPEGAADTNTIRVSTWTTPEGDAAIEVSDTGSGISLGAIDRIFEPFFTTKPDGLGTGLGLAICRTTVHALGGTIKAVNLPEGGAAFQVTLPPLAEREQTVPAEVRANDSASQKRGRIYVIDDEPVIVRSLARVLGKDHDVMTATSGREVLERCRGGERFDAILCDLMMPDLSGMDLHQMLCVVAPEQARKMIFLTGGAFTARAAAFLDSGTNPWVEKPYDAGNVRAIVRSVVAGGPAVGSGG